MPDALPPERLADIEARCDAATPGPWIGVIEPTYYAESYDADLPGSVRAPDGREIAHVHEHYGVGLDSIYERDMAFIAASRTDVSTLIAEVRRLQAEREWRPIETAPTDGTRIWGLVGDDAKAMFYHPQFGFVSSFRRMIMADGYTIDDQPYKDHSPEVVPAEWWRPILARPPGAA